MSARDDGGNAFPVQKEYDQHGHPLENGADGMSLRDYFAGQALIGAMSSAQGMGDMAPRDRSRVLDGTAAILYEVADAMIRERSR